MCEKCRHGSFDDEAKEILKVSTEDAYKMAMKGMLKWVNKNMDPQRTRVFFTSMSPSHFKLVKFSLNLQAYIRCNIKSLIGIFFLSI